MKTKLLFTIACIFFLFSSQVFSSMSFGLNQNTEMQSETQFANGKMLTVKVHSPGIANNKLGDSEYRKVSVYLPPGYDQNGDTNYPVIYMLSDVNGTNEGWAQLSTSRPLPEILDKLIQSESIKPMIMVFPDGKNKLGGGWYTNSPVTGNWEDFIVTDLVNYIDKNFRTLPFAASRGIAGKGMGGYGALKLATKHPEIFSAVYSLNALVDFETIITHEYLWKNSFTIASQAKKYPTSDEFANQLLGMAVAFSPDIFNPLTGKLPKTETGEIVAAVRQQWLEQDPLYMIQENLKNLKSLKAITVDCSTSEVGIMLNSNYSEALKSKNIKHTFVYFNGAENDALLKRITNVLLPVFSNNLAHSLLELNAKPFYINSEILKARMISDGSIYIVPNETSTLKSIDENKIVKLDVKANALNEIPLANLNKGIYRIYGVSSTGFTDKPHEFGLNGGIPQIKICVTDSYCGDKIKTCGVNINGKCYTTNADGELCIPENEFPKEGKATICMQKENYSGLTKSVTILTDTTLRFTLVRDSYVQVVERGIGMPIFEAMVTHDNIANLTGSNGFATVHNLHDGLLDCRIFKAGYFTETLNSTLNPGQTAVVTLTPIKADIHFVLVGDKGVLSDLSIKLGEAELGIDQDGRVRFTNVDARKEYTYSVKFAGNEITKNTFFLNNDTTVVITSLVKDSYLQVVEKGNGMPIFEAMVTHNNIATLTGSNGFAAIQNLYDGVLDCRIFKTGYFTEICKLPLDPGKSVVVALTPKKAEVNFILIGNQGHLDDGTIKFGKLNVKPDQNGRVCFKDIDTRREYNYSIENASYEVISGTLFITNDTTVAFYLQPKGNLPVNDNIEKAGQLITGSSIISDSKILIYPNPAKSSVTVQINQIKGFTVELRTETGALLFKTKTEGTSQQINLSNLSNGVYFVTIKSDNLYHTRKIMKL